MVPLEAVENGDALGGAHNENGSNESTTVGSPNSSDLGKSPTKLPSLASNQSSMFDMRESHDLEWSNFNFVVNDTKQVLTDVWGKVESGKICAIMGSSGAGKSSLLNIIAGRSASAPGIKISGKMTVGGHIVNPVKFRKNIAYVMQDDGLMATATPREALRFSAALRLEQYDEVVVNDLVEQTLGALGITDCADTFIGSDLIKGISGGQRKRTSVGIELITKPSIILLDEPTSGLDSYTAYSLIKLLKKIAKSNATILFTIHQPSSETFHLFDSVIFMKSGRIVYQGPSTALVSWLSTHSFQCPQNYNPADYAMFIMQTETDETFEEKGMFMKGKQIQEKGSDDTDTELVLTVKSPFVRQLYWLISREFRNSYRNVPALAGRFGVTIILNLIFGLIFYNAARKDGSDPDNFNSYFGSLTMVAISSMFGQAQPTLLEFPSERPMFMREYSTGTYASFSYFLSKLSMEAPLSFLQTVVQYLVVYWLIGYHGNFILLVLASWVLGMASSSLSVFLGALIPDPKQAVEMSPLLFVPQILFAGFFVRTSLIPVWLRWAQYLCSLKYGINLLITIEFNPGNNYCDGGAHQNCVDVLENNDVVFRLWWLYIVLLLVLLVVTRAIAAVVLAKNSVRFY